MTFGGGEIGAWPVKITGTFSFVPSFVGAPVVQKKPKVRCQLLNFADRNAKIEEMYRRGAVLEDISQEFGITRERVRQILAIRHVDPNSGGAKKKFAMMRETRTRLIDRKLAMKAERKAKCLDELGVDEETYAASKNNGMLRKFKNDRENQKILGNDWSLSFGEWLSLWSASGHIGLIGSKKAWLKRIDSTGPFAVGNVRVMLREEAVRIKRGSYRSRWRQAQMEAGR